MADRPCYNARMLPTFTVTDLHQIDRARLTDATDPCGSVSRLYTGAVSRGSDFLGQRFTNNFSHIWPDFETGHYRFHLTAI